TRGWGKGAEPPRPGLAGWWGLWGRARRPSAERESVSAGLLGPGRRGLGGAGVPGRGLVACGLPVRRLLVRGGRLLGLIGLIGLIGRVRLLGRRGGGLRATRGLGAAGCLATAAELEPARLGRTLARAGGGGRVAFGGLAGLLGALGVLDLGPRLGGLLARRGGLRTARGLGAAGCLATAAEFEPAGLGCALRVGDGRAGLGRAHGAPGPGRRDLGALALVDDLVVRSDLRGLLGRRGGG